MLIDIIKIISAILIIGSHSLPIFHKEIYNYFYGQWFFRFSVPFFMIVTGYFFSKANNNKRRKQIKKIFTLYIISTILYIPFIILYRDGTISYWIKTFLFGYFHLWYLVAVAIGLILWCVLERILGKYTLGIAVFLLAVGIVFDEYHILINSTVIEKMSFVVDEYLGGARNAVFFAFPMLYLGKVINIYEKKLKALNLKMIGLLLIVVSILSYCEAWMILNKVGITATLDVSIFGWGSASIFFVLALKLKNRIKLETTKDYKIALMLRKSSMLIYIIHPWCLAVLSLLEMNYYIKFILGIMLSIIGSIFLIVIDQYIRKRNIIKK